MVEGGRASATTLASAAFVLIGLLQIGIPAQAATEERPARYGWQMYSTVSPAPDAWTEDETGRRSAVDVIALMADPRAEIRWTEPLVARLCREPDVRAVIVRERGTEERFACG